jgi:hypothetical protein
MPTTTRAYGAPSAKAKLAPMTIERREPGLNDVAIDIAYAGIRHTDVHQTDEAWGEAIFPMVPGRSRRFSPDVQLARPQRQPEPGRLLETHRCR